MTPSRQGARRVEMALPAILELIGAVRSGDVHEVKTAVDLLDLPAAVVLLAGMVNDSCTAGDLPAWTDQLTPLGPLLLVPRPPVSYEPLLRASRGLVPCGSHAAFNRHRSHRETPCEPCAAAETAYQAARQIRRRATQPTEGAA